jgi:hypothetical protein
VEEVIEERIPVTTQRMEYEEREEQIPVKVCRMVTENRILQEPRTVAKWIAVEQTRLTPRTVAMRVPVDPCGQVIESHYYPAESTTTRRAIVESEPVRVESQRPVTETPKKVETTETQRVEPMPDPATSGDDAESGEIQLDDRSKIVPRNGTNGTNGATEEPMDTDPTGQPKLNGPNLNGASTPNEAKREPTAART